MSTPQNPEERRLDGNALSGTLADVFTFDASIATVTCAHCGQTGPLAAQHLYPDAPALVLRCPSCTSVVLRYSSDERGIRLDMTGTRLLSVAQAE